ncbi:methyltransferase [Emydomyces testavorans]|uniref:DNA (cytosine-5-)-methyltransferase n=1 Tax=Emydomyces testavorans TaxID=2070801 RepID=A0AAF0DMC9_9EURO|nr:methyltransferase [Emydomyces testavorans]
MFGNEDVIIINDDASSITLSADESIWDGFDPQDFMTDDDFDAYITSLSSSSVPSNRHLAQPQSPIPIPRRTPILQVSVGGKTYRKGKSVELNDGTFLRIHKVLQGEGNELFLRGPRFQRLEYMDSLVPDRVNELCWVIDLNSDGGESGDDSFEEVPMHEVKGLRIIHLTNYPYCDLNISTKSMGSCGQDECHQEGLLYCRIKYLRVWNRTSRKHRVLEEALVFLTKEECDPGFAIEPVVLRQSWRGPTQPGGSYTPPLIDLTGGNERRVQYTFGDGFCGAGGVSRGALQAGLHVSWGFDKCPKAMDSYRLNFQTAVGETCEVTDFLTNDSKDIMVDILHFSPPCQTFSSAKTVAAATDHANEACIFSARELLLKVKPRIATMEETSGLQERHKEFLYATIHTFVDLGYSIRWKLLACEAYGVPQQRKRLVMIGAGPGESLPPFPKPTHGPPESGLRPYRTILDAIGGIPESAPDHDPERAYFRNIVKSPYSPHSFAKTITCNGGDNFHPSGTRAYTHREAACLQTFPMEHRFCGFGVLKQIGNAVPPMLATAIFKEIIKDLKRADGVRQ